MPSLIDLRRRIRAVKSTQQITKAMKMIAASRLRRAQDRVVAARPFAQRMLKVLNGLVSRVDQDAHPLLKIPVPGEGRPLLIVITADRGLCGSFNSNVIKAAGQFILNEAPGRDIALGLIGRKGRDFFRRRGFDIRYEAVGIFQKLTFGAAVDIADAAIEEFVSARASSVYLVYNEFKSVMTQRLVVERLLPIPRLEGEPGNDRIPDPESRIPAGVRLLRERLERRGISRWQRRPSHVEHHRDHRVVAVQADQVHHPLLAVLAHHARVRAVGHAVKVVQLVAEVVDDLHPLAQPLGTAAVGNGLDDGVAEARGPAIGRVHVPFVLLRPPARDEQDRELADVARQ
jgi:F-type H+-transporting ATPase subunit gamma